MSDNILVQTNNTLKSFFNAFDFANLTGNNKKSKILFEQALKCFLFSKEKVDLG